MAKRARMKGKDAWVVCGKTKVDVTWSWYWTRRDVDKIASFLRKDGYKTKAWICRVPFSCFYQNDGGRNMKEFIAKNYPHCVGED